MLPCGIPQVIVCMHGRFYISKCSVLFPVSKVAIFMFISYNAQSNMLKRYDRMRITTLKS